MTNLESRKQLDADVAKAVLHVSSGGMESLARIVKLAYAYIDLVADIEATESPVEVVEIAEGDLVRLTGLTWGCLGWRNREVVIARIAPSGEAFFFDDHWGVVRIWEKSDAVFGVTLVSRGKD